MKPTKADLLLVIGELQNMIGHANAVNHDRNPNRYTEVTYLLQKAQSLCVDVRSEFSPVSRKKTNFWIESNNQEFSKEITGGLNVQ